MVWGWYDITGREVMFCESGGDEEDVVGLRETTRNILRQAVSRYPPELPAQHTLRNSLAEMDAPITEMHSSLHLFTCC